MFFHRRLEQFRPELRGKTDYQITGFGEDGAKFMRYPSTNHNFLSAMDLCDFSQGFPGTFHRLYDRCGAEEPDRHLKLRVFPRIRGSR